MCNIREYRIFVFNNTSVFFYFQLPTGEFVYHVAAVAILYNLESHTQRHYMGHTNDIECMNVHPGSLALVATGQAEGHDHVNCTIQKPHVQVVKNYWFEKKRL